MMLPGAFVRHYSFIQPLVLCYYFGKCTFYSSESSSLIHLISTIAFAVESVLVINNVSFDNNNYFILMINSCSYLLYIHH